MSRTKLIKTPRNIKRINSLIAWTLLPRVRQYQKELEMIFYEHTFSFKMALMKEGGKFSLIRMLTTGYNLFRNVRLWNVALHVLNHWQLSSKGLSMSWGSVTWDTKWEMKYKWQSITGHKITLGKKGDSFIDTLHWEKQYQHRRNCSERHRLEVFCYKYCGSLRIDKNLSSQ